MDAQWQGICWYRKTFPSNPGWEGKRIWVRFDAAMNVADVYVNGEHVGKHLGGYLPIVYDITDHVLPDGENVIAVRLDNTDNTVTGPKPLARLDFNTYHGLYRHAYLIVKDPLHITDPILADTVSGGGLLVTTDRVSDNYAVVKVQTHIRNQGDTAAGFELRTRLMDGEKEVTDASQEVELQPDEAEQVTLELTVDNPRLWSPQHPNLYRVESAIISDGAVADSRSERIGIRTVQITADGLLINGQPAYLRGTNRHQEYPYIGYALSDNAQYREALKIKQAGFDFVRMSHYPHSPAFMDACDELGIAVMDSIFGWQYFNRDDPAFTEFQYRQTRDLVRRDRNHPSVILWEASLNESGMPREFIATMHQIVHEELPSDNTYSCGWRHGYDVFVQARQHDGCTEESGPCMVSEYGDWEYFAQDAGLNQDGWVDMKKEERSSRQLRGNGERALLQQAANFQEAHNDNRKTIAFADGLWVMFDYNRGYEGDLEASGPMDLFRLPKFGYYFFRSQRPPDERYEGVDTGPMVFIANYWTPDSPLDVRVFTNCEEVELRLNGNLIGRVAPAPTSISDELAYPPVVFEVEAFEAGDLMAVGFIDGLPVAQHSVQTPRGEPAQLWLRPDISGRSLTAGQSDAIFLHAVVVDQFGTPVPDATPSVTFRIDEAPPGVSIIGDNPTAAEAGIATILLRAGEEAGSITLTAQADGLTPGELHLEVIPTNP